MASQWSSGNGNLRRSDGRLARRRNILFWRRRFCSATWRRRIGSPKNAEWEEKTKGKTEFIEKVMAPRLGKATAPEPIVPSGKLTQTEVRETFLAQRVKIETFAAKTDVALKEHTVEHPFPVFNTLNAFQWLIYVPLHTMRHDKQIAEVKATTGYPM